MKTKTVVQPALREPLASRAHQLEIREKYEQAASPSWCPALRARSAMCMTVRSNLR